MQNYFEKILALQQKCPRMGMTSAFSENSDYIAYSQANKNCYLLVGSEHDEDCLYGNWIYESKDCVDGGFLFKCELCYECLDCESCYNCSFCQDCTTCMDCSYCYDCKGCQNCFGCVGLRNAQYNIFNQPVPREEYKDRVKAILKDGNFLSKFEDLKKTTPRLFSHALDNENVTGDYLYHSKNSFFCFDGKKLQDCLYVTSSIECRDCVDGSNMYWGSELSYEIMSAIELYNSNFCNFCYWSRDLEYCEYLFHCQNCFGCFSLQHKQYYIFNEPFSKDDYFKKVSEIKAAMKQEGSYGKQLPSTILPEDSSIINYFPKG